MDIHWHGVCLSIYIVFVISLSSMALAWLFRAIKVSGPIVCDSSLEHSVDVLLLSTTKISEGRVTCLPVVVM